MRATAPLRIDRLLRLSGGAMAHTDTRMTLHVAMTGGMRVQRGSGSTAQRLVVARAQRRRYGSCRAAFSAHGHRRCHGCPARRGARLRIDLLLLMRRTGVMAHADAHITLHTAIRGGTTCIQQGNSSTRHCSVLTDAQQGRYAHANTHSTLHIAIIGGTLGVQRGNGSTAH